MSRFNSIEFGRQLQLLRKKKGLTQEQFAEKCDLTVSALKTWEQGKKDPGFRYVMQIADVLNEPLDIFQQKKNEEKQAEENLYKEIPLSFGSIRPNVHQKLVLDFCKEVIDSLDKNIFTSGVFQNSEFGTGQYFWEEKLDNLMFIGETQPLYNKNPKYTFSVALNTEVTLPDKMLSKIDCIQVSDKDGGNWIYIPFDHEGILKGSPFSKQLKKSAMNAIIAAMCVFRKSLEPDVNSKIESVNKL